MSKTLVRNTNKKFLAGVVAGLQDAYFPHVDLTLLRVLFLAATFFIHPLAVVYLLLWVLLPTTRAFCIKRPSFLGF